VQFALDTEMVAGMDEVWRSAPLPAMRVWRTPDGSRHALNQAAQRWADAAGLAPAVWSHWAAEHADAAQPADLLLSPVAHMPPLSCRRVPLPDGCLLWVGMGEPAPARPSPDPGPDSANLPWAGEVAAPALSMSGLSVWQVRLAAQRIYLNPQGFQLMGMPHHPLGLPLGVVRAKVHPADLPAIEAAAEAALHGNGVVDALARYDDGQGHWRHLLTRRFAQRDAQGQPQCLVGVSIDLTELVQERDRSLALLDRTRLVADAIGVGFWWRDLDLGTLEWDERMYRLHHRAPDEGTPSLDEFLDRHVHPDDRAHLRARQASHIASWPPASELSFRILTPDGRTRWIQSWTRRLWRDGRRLSFGMHVDVTERREAELRIERERERDRFAIEASGVGVWERPLDGRPPHWSPTMYRLRGLSPTDPRPLGDLVGLTTPPEQVAEADLRMAECVASHSGYRHEYTVVWPDGQKRWLMSTGQLLHDSQGRISALAGVTVDVTERRLAEQMARERDRAEQASAAKSELMARVSHELRTPMNAVLGFAELMALDQLSPLQQERLERIRSAGQHLLGLIDDLLDLAQADGKGQPPLREAVALDGLLQEALQWVAPLSRESGVSLQLTACATDAQVMADRRRLGQVISNLLSNGIKYNRPGGCVTLAVEPVAEAGQSGWRLSVEDNGRGMSPAQQTRLFEPFNRLGMEREGIPGTGIGLSIVRQLVHDMAGQLAVVSAEGQGSRFSVWLPAADSPSSEARGASPAQPQAEPVAPPSAARSVRVLYVEDNPVNELLVRQMLAMQAGFDLRSAPDGQSGIRAALTEPPDILLLDLQLPDMSGLEVLAHLRAEPALGATRFVALSANAMAADVQAALACGFDAYWTKPLDVARFLADMAAMAVTPPRAT